MTYLPLHFEVFLCKFHSTNGARLCQTNFQILRHVIAGSLESANSSILAARRHFKEVVGKKSGFYYNELGQSP